MEDDPIAAAIRQVPHNELLLEGSATKDRKQAGVTLERDFGNQEAGVKAGISSDQGWSVGGFYRWMFGGKK